MTTPVRAPWLAVLLAAAATAVGPAESAAQRSLLLETFHSDIHVQRDASIVVEETIRPRFTGEWNGLLRVLSLRPPADYGARYRLDAQLISATDGAGRALRTEVERPDRDTRRFRIWVPDAQDRTATVVLTYRVTNALGFFEPGPADDWQPMDELNWQVTGTEWEVPILSASARVTLPAGAAPLQSAAYVGQAASTTPATARTTGSAVDVPPVGRLDPGHGLTVAVGWPAGFVTRPDPADRRGAPGRPGPLAFWPLLLPFGVFWWGYRAWSRTGRDPAERAITVQWEPPDNLSPVAAGTLVDHRADMHDILSILVHLAVRGYLVIEERERTGFLKSGKEYHFHLMRPRDQWSELEAYERLFLHGLFDPASKPARKGLLQAIGAMGRADTPPPDDALQSVSMEDLQNRFYKKLPGIRNAVYDALVAKGHYRERPDRVRARWGLFTGLAFAAGTAGAFVAAGGTADAIATGLAMLVAGMASAIMLGVFAWIMPARSEKGARAREATLGFKQFLERVESPRFRRMITSPEQFEAFLPYAMAFRCEDRWARAFDDILNEPPDWYRGSHGMAAFHPSTFTSNLSTMSTAAISTLASSPSSSGSGGGGSVGGGAGGGGGGGF